MQNFRQQKIPRVIVGAGVSFALVGSTVMVAQATMAGSRVACNDHVVRDYAQAFRRMRHVHPPPKAGVLPFAPQGTQFFQTSASQIQVTHGAFGYAFTASHPQRRVRLNWLVSTTITKVNQQGDVVRVVDRRHRRFNIVRDIRNLDFTVPLNTGVGVYRYEIQFRKLDGSKLASYSQYVRVLQPKFKAKLLLSPTTYRSGDLGLLQPVNNGSLAITSGEEVRVAKFEDGDWVPATEFSIPLVRRRVRRLDAGQAGTCEQFTIPAEVRPGIYRLEMRVTSLLGHKIRTLIARFSVEG